MNFDDNFKVSNAEKLLDQIQFENTTVACLLLSLFTTFNLKKNLAGSPKTCSGGI